MHDPYFQLRRQVREWLDEYKCSQARLSKTLGFSEGLLSGFINGEVGLSVANFSKLNAYTSAPWVNPNAGARITQAQRFGRKMPDLPLDSDNMAEFETDHAATNLSKMQLDILNHNQGTTFEGNL
jgi:hypothetical protein